MGHTPIPPAAARASIDSRQDPNDTVMSQPRPPAVLAPPRGRTGRLDPPHPDTTGFAHLKLMRLELEAASTVA